MPAHQLDNINQIDEIGEFHPPRYNLESLKSKIVEGKHLQRILFVEDDEDFGDLVAPLIERELKSHVVRARDPYEAMNLFVDGYYDLVVLDWNLQDLSGKETLKKTENLLANESELPLQWEESQVPVIILSAYDRENFSDINGGFFRLAGSVTKNQSLQGILTSLKLINNDIHQYQKSIQKLEREENL